MSERAEKQNRRGLMYWLNRPIGEVFAHATGAAEDKARIAPAPEKHAGGGAGSLADRLVDEGEIGRGGMGQVHRVYDKTLMRRVAMKILDPRRLQKQSQLQRFAEEAQITGQLDHPNIPPVHEFGVDEEGTHYFTMKLVKGRTLDDILADPSFSPANEKELFSVLQIFVKVCQAISFAHSRGVIHCDLKPSNVMVGSHGQVYVMDWGIARIVGRARPSGADEAWVEVRRTERAADEEEEGNSDQAKIVGTLQYMSPEQAQGRTQDIDESTDVFCLGAMLYKILTGRRESAGRKQVETFMAAARA
ncbi:MAG: serine/threonine-protein kinase [Myxococcales bacterium]